MAIIKKKELHAMTPDALDSKLVDVRRELNTERGLVRSGGRSQNPGRIRELRRTVARILTLRSQKVAAAAAGSRKAPAPARSPAAKPAKKSEVKPSA